MSRFTNCFKTVNYVYLVVLSGNFLALTGDIAITWSSPVIPKLNSTTENPLNHNVTEDQLSWVASSAGLGSLIGVLPFSFLPDLIGRKPCLLMIAIPHIAAFGLAAIAKTIEILYVVRFLSGLSICACYLVLPMYVAEISENSNRGLMLVSFAIFSNFGCLISYVAGPYMSMFDFNIFLLIFPVTFFISFLFIAPESPYYHVIRKDYANALKSIDILRQNNVYSNADLELKGIQEQLENSKKGDILNTLRKRYAIKGSIIAIVLTCFQQLSGYAVFIPYTQSIFQKVSPTIDSAVSALIVGCVAFFASFFCPFLIDKKGRRFVLIISTIGIIVSEAIFGTYYYLDAHAYNLDSVKWIPLACLMIYMLFFTFGLGPLPLTVSSEILPVNIKFLMCTIAGLLGALSSTLLSKNYFFLNDNLTYAGTIWLFMGLSTFLLVFIITMLPETKGKSFSEILEKLDK